MKKTLLLISFICAGMFLPNVNSQNIQLCDKSGTSFTNGTAFYIWDTLTLMNFEGLRIKNIGSSTINVKCKKIETSLVEGASCYMCFQGSCFSSGAFTSPKQDTLSPNEVDSSFSGHVNPLGNLGESIITFVFFNVANTSDSAWVVVHFTATPVGINEIASMNAEVSNPYPNPAVLHTSFDYHFPKGTSSANFILSDLLGSKVYETDIQELEGKLTLNTADLKEGIYLYSFYVNHKMILTKKLIIRH
jgi:hypothetical protein